MKYPGKIIKVGERDPEIIRALKLRLNKVLALEPAGPSWLDPAEPVFDETMKRAVKLFQARNVDERGVALVQDGQVGSLTWGAMFGTNTVVVDREVRSALFADALRIASAEEAAGVREVPRNSNRGPRVEKYLARVDCPPGSAWCCAFVYWCVDEASRGRGIANPLVKTGGCLDHWNRAPSRGARRIPKQQAANDPSLVKPGMLFIIDHGGGLGHTGFIKEVVGGLFVTVEGNTDASKTREGGGVYRLTRKVSEINRGYIDYQNS